MALFTRKTTRTNEADTQEVTPVIVFPARLGAEWHGGFQATDGAWYAPKRVQFIWTAGYASSRVMEGDIVGWQRVESKWGAYIRYEVRSEELNTTRFVEKDEIRAVREWQQIVVVESARLEQAA